MAAANPGVVKFVAGALFPVGLIMVSITGADLFTSDCASFTFPVLGREIAIGRAAMILLISYLFNFIGAQFIAYVLSANIGMLDVDPWRSYLFELSDAKVNRFQTVFWKGIAPTGWLPGYVYGVPGRILSADHRDMDSCDAVCYFGYDTYRQYVFIPAAHSGCGYHLGAF